MANAVYAGFIESAASGLKEKILSQGHNGAPLCFMFIIFSKVTKYLRNC